MVKLAGNMKETKWLIEDVQQAYNCTLQDNKKQKLKQVSSDLLQKEMMKMIKMIATKVAEFKIIKEESGIFLSSKGYGRGCFWTEEEEVDWTSSVEEVEEYLYEQYGNRY